MTTTTKKPLPKTKRPLFTLTLPSTGEKVHYHSFSGREEKTLLMAKESEDPAQNILAVKQVVNNCLVDKSISDISMFDLEYIMLVLRSKSIDNMVSVIVKDPDTEEDVNLEFDLDTVKVNIPEGHTNKVKIDDTYTLFMRYPSIDEFLTLITEGDTPETGYKIMNNCLDKLVSENEVFEFSEFSDKEIEEFILDLDAETLKAIRNFFETVPRLRHEMKYVTKDGKDKTFVIEGIQSFFT
ncbi:MAG: hypothetical protein WCY93_10505 [Anaerolineaceae bacterium]